MKSLNEYLLNENMSLNIEEAVKFLDDIVFPKEFTLSLDVDAIHLSDSLKSLMISRSIGQIVESVIFAHIESKFLNDSAYDFKYLKNNKSKDETSGVENNSCDCYIKNKETGEALELEIKAYKKVSNPHLTGNQAKCYILGVKYKQDGGKITIEQLTFGKAEENQKRLNTKFEKDGIQITLGDDDKYLM